ncbi:MAG: PTS sugar transporter subunit IIA [Oscillospiraceae bacterium]|nr:PTS sugar transporter subunit IIA [Oscillospiraceae bacterium]
MLELDKRNVILGLEASDRDDCIRKIVAHMAENGYVGLDYADAVIERENKYPTGLPTEGVVTAIPHANCGTVHITGMALAVLTHPVGFYNMADSSELLKPEIVCVIANTDASQQLSTLRQLMTCFSEEELLLKIKAAATAEEIIDILANAEED